MVDCKNYHTLVLSFHLCLLIVQSHFDSVWVGFLTCFGQWDISKWHKQRLEKHLLTGTCPFLSALGKPVTPHMWLNLHRLHVSIRPGDLKSTVRYVSKPILGHPIPARSPVVPDHRTVQMTHRILRKINYSYFEPLNFRMVCYTVETNWDAVCYYLNMSFHSLCNYCRFPFLYPIL